jgi:predicted DNA-binding protein
MVEYKGLEINEESDDGIAKSSFRLTCKQMARVKSEAEKASCTSTAFIRAIVEKWLNDNCPEPTAECSNELQGGISRRSHDNEVEIKIPEDLFSRLTEHVSIIKIPISHEIKSFWADILSSGIADGYEFVSFASNLAKVWRSKTHWNARNRIVTKTLKFQFPDSMRKELIGYANRQDIPVSIVLVATVYWKMREKDGIELPEL